MIEIFTEWLAQQGGVTMILSGIIFFGYKSYLKIETKADSDKKALQTKIDALQAKLDGCFNDRLIDAKNKKP